MATKPKARSVPRVKKRRPIRRSSPFAIYYPDFLRLVLAFTGVFILLALYSYNPSAKANQMGIFGQVIGTQLLLSLGLPAYGLGLMLAIIAIYPYLSRRKNLRLFTAGGVGGLLLFCVLLQKIVPWVSFQGRMIASGGQLGQHLDKILALYLGPLGTLAVLFTCAGLCFFLLSQRRIVLPIYLPKFSLRKIFPRAKPAEVAAQITDAFETSRRFVTPVGDSTLLNRRAELLLDALAGFDIEGTIADIQVGPVVSTFAFRPRDGIRQAKIVGLAKDLALRLQVETLSVLPMPELQSVGFQIPNDQRPVILFGDLIQDEGFHSSKEPLNFIIGKDVSGRVVHESLVKLPHLLIAGSTGSGKSIGIHCFLCSLLVSTPNSMLRLVLIDPKMLELAPYGGLPHLLHPIITTPDGAMAVMDKLVDEMNQRYRMMAEAKTRDIVTYNAARPSKAFPYIVLVIDEYAELALMTQKKIELPLVQLAQKSRASGIHIVLSTQRPSIDVITGLIKANFPARLSYKVASGIDSRTILNQLGAEKLLGKGDLLFYKPGFTQPLRCHGPYVDEKSVEKMVAMLSAKV